VPPDSIQPLQAPATPSPIGRSAIVALAVIALVLAGLLAASSGLFTQGGTASPAACGGKTLQYINENMVQPGTMATLTGVRGEKGLYAMDIQYQSQNMTVYTTTDCSLFFPGPIDLNAPPAAPPAATQQPARRSFRPEADLFVMSFCPYGTQAEETMKPVEDLLGSNADIRIRYITTITGTTTGSVQSLHGAGEAYEDLWQVCILNKTPAKFWDYLQIFDRQCYPLSQNTTALEACRQNATASLGLDTGAITGCAAGPDGLSLLKADEDDVEAAGVSGSPTLLINSVEYTGARTPDAYKTAVCGSFTSPPAGCNTTLPASADTAGGGCG